jgi:4'-phosphopantetheinyl transferase
VVRFYITIDMRVLGDYGSGAEYLDWIVDADREGPVIRAIAEAFADHSQFWDCILDAGGRLASLLRGPDLANIVGSIKRENYPLPMIFKAIRASLLPPGGDTPRGAVRFPAPNEVHVWFADIEGGSDADRRVLSPDERTRADRFRFDRDRDHFTAARATLRRMLALYLGDEPRRYEFGFGEKGKPFLAGAFAACGLEFNLSHAQGLAAYAFGCRRRVGVDVEVVKPLVEADEIAGRFFSAREAEGLRSLRAEEKSRAFFNGWTRKEAFVKAVGEGLSYPLHRFEVSLGTSGRLIKVDVSSRDSNDWSLVEVEAPVGYVAAVAAAGVDWRLLGPLTWQAPAMERGARGEQAGRERPGAAYGAKPLVAGS